MVVCVDFQLLYPSQGRHKCGLYGADGAEFMFLIVNCEIAHYLKHFSAGNRILKSFHIKALTSSDLSHT